jgi:pimeloyl-ACP methyl ester carboxylesterase
MASINYKIINSTVSGNKSSWLLFIHGLGGSINSWDKQVETFKKEFNLILVDLPGHGASQLDENVILSFPIICSEIIEVLNEVNIKEVSVIGVSLGSTIAYLLRKLYPDYINKIILSGAIIYVDRRMGLIINVASILAYIFGYKRVYILAVFLIYPLSLNPLKNKRNRIYRNDFFRESQSLTNTSFKFWAKLLINLKPNLNVFLRSEILDKCLIMMGSSDYVFLPSIHSLKKVNLNIRVDIFKNSGHVLNLEDSDNFNKHVIKYLKSNEPANLEDKVETKNIEIYFNYQFNAVKEAGEGLNKILTVYLALMTTAAIYVFSKQNNFDVYEVQIIAKILLIITILVMIISPVIVYGIYKGVQSINDLMFESNKHLYYSLDMLNFTKRGLYTILLLGILLVLGIVIILIILFPLIKRYIF